MSDISVSNQNIRSIALDDQARSVESGTAGIALDARTLNRPEFKPLEESQSDIAGQVASRTRDYLGSGTDLSSAGTDNNIQQAVNAALQETGVGTIADEIA